MATDKKIEIRLLTPAVRSTQSQYKYHNEAADMVIVRTITGDRGFLHGHEPCSVVLDAGVLRILRGDDQDELKLAVLGGVAQMDDNILTIITETADWPEDIDRNRATAWRDDILARMEKAELAELEDLKKELRSAELLITVSGFPPSGITHE
ncbi:MAG: F0F1 ATP synthase subunit epsilon [Defluviitaleaceae bacterium]|nr:F0F1 ATP synthase subunit epsilon [Defluviitaleaceae bacterium]MCL2239955.1 F0F1 ATP synthase subunit epsilon [Defluviitaleaceae bacterium]